MASGAAGCCRACCVAGTGAARGCCSGPGVSGTGPGSGTGWSPSPPGAAQPPPPPPSVGGQDRHRSAAMRHGGQGSAWGRPSAAPLAAQGCSSPSADPRGGGGALEPGLHSTSAVIRRGGRPTLHSRTCTCGRGWGSAQPEIWAGSLLGGSHIGWRPRSFRRAAIRWGGAGGGKGLIYLYTAVFS